MLQSTQMPGVSRSSLRAKTTQVHVYILHGGDSGRRAGTRWAENTTAWAPQAA